MKALQEDSVFHDAVYQQESRQALAQVLKGRMQARVSAHLEQCKSQGLADRRNGHYTRRMMLGAGEVELDVPRTRRYSPAHVLGRYARRAPQLDRLILSCFTLGLSTRKVGEAMLTLLGEPVSPSTVSQVARQLDAQVAAFHRRRLSDAYTVLMFDGVVLSRKTGAGAIKRPVLVALGLRADGKKEVIDFRMAPGESQAAWEAFLNDLYTRGLRGAAARLAVTDGGPGLLAALPLVYPQLPVQRCWAHKARNILDKVRKVDQQAVKTDLHQVMYAAGTTQARSAARHFAGTWQASHSKAVACLKNDLDELLAHLRIFKDPTWRRRVRTTNAIERCFAEVKRRTRPMGVMADRASAERILYAVFTGINRSQGTATPFLLTHNS
jgi:transposase-like protein